ncbi:MAG: hypothetical protein NVSMB9_04200 [Isosphaeraceae bacterium]
MATGWKRVKDDPVWTAGLILVIATATTGWDTGFRSPPRFDGAGYAVLARSLASGRGYREIDHPDAPRHTHFPPGYPSALAMLWRATGSQSSRAAHGLSLACTVAATLIAWRWFLTLYKPGVATILGVALALNWTWVRTGGSIQSEPLFLLLETLILLLASQRWGRKDGVPGVVLGVLLAACTLTRHVGIMLGAAVVLDLIGRRRWRVALEASLTCVILLLPWVAWLAHVRGNTQVGLMAHDGLGGRIAALSLFYVQRMPDQLTGPIVEIGTVFQRRSSIAIVVNIWAALATGLFVFGWRRTLRVPRRRLAGLTAFSSLALLLVWPFSEAGRFLIPLVPCLLVGSVEGLAPLAALAGVKRPRAFAAAGVLVASLPYSAYALVSGRAEAQRRTHDVFDAACSWIAHEGRVSGPILSRHPGEVYWQTGRKTLAPTSDDPQAIESLIDQWRVAYLLVDGARYANAPASPLAVYVDRHPERAREVWPRSSGESSVRVYEVVTGSAPRTGGPRNPRSGESSADAGEPNS